MATKKTVKKVEGTKKETEEVMEASAETTDVPEETADTVETAEETEGCEAASAGEQEESFDVEVVRKFKDKYTGEVHSLKETMTVTESRFKELTAKKKYVVRI